MTSRTRGGGRPPKISDAGQPSLSVLEPAAARWISALIRMASPHPAMTRILTVVERLQERPFTTNVLLLGEPGTGKEGLARALHQLMAPGTPLVRFDPTLQSAAGDDEPTLAALCGEGKTPGAAELADGGFLLIEEATAMSLRTQAELLRLLKTGRVRHRHAARDENRRLRVKAIVVADRDLDAAVAAGRFRHDLYYRLARIVLWLPPLRERLEDVGAAAIWMGNRVLAEAGIPLTLRGVEDMRRATPDEKRRSIELGESALQALRGHDFPGNFRELEAVMERALLLYRTGSELSAAEISAALEPAVTPT